MLIKYFHEKISKFNRSRRFHLFQKRINSQTRARHRETLEWAAGNAYNSELNEGTRNEGLRNDVLIKFRNLYQFENNIRVLVHVPAAKSSPGGYSVFSNLMESLRYIGIPCQQLELGNNLKNQLSIFAPTVLLTSDSMSYLELIDWGVIRQYRINHQLLIGLTASIEAYGNTPIAGRLKWAKKNQVDFYYSFRAPEYIRNRKDYLPFFDEGYNIHSIEFGANPLLYYPVTGVKKNIPFVFFGSSNADKQNRYLDWFDPLMTKSPGFINGYGWNGMCSTIPMNVNKYILARAQVGINLHLEEQVEWACELNERTYVLAACGVPQLVDNARLLSERFSSESLFVANNPKEYAELFDYLISNPNVAAGRAEVALREVYEKHTTFHRAESLVLQIKHLIKATI